MKMIKKKESRFIYYIITVCTLWSLLGVAGGIKAILGTANATPLRDPENQGVIRWPNRTVIHVYVPNDPDNLNRHNDLAIGIREWNNRAILQNRGITIQTHNGLPPPGATNAVTVEWVSGAIDTTFGEGGPIYNTNGVNTTTGGTIRISRDTNHVDNQMARNIGIHEMGHVLGLADVTIPNAAMNPNFTRENRLNIGQADDRELGAIYAANFNDTQVEIIPQIIREVNYFRYTYTLKWISGQEGLALFQISTSGVQLFDFITPTGWGIGIPLGEDVIMVRNNLHLDVGSILGYKPGDPFVSFVLEDENSYLGPDHRLLVFGFSSFASPGNVMAFINGTSNTIGPVPEPSTLILLSFGLSGVIGFAVKKFFKKI